MDKQQNCKNKCIFCFVAKTPKGMRESFYFKDDDARLSFLFGNYITLTNFKGPGHPADHPDADQPHQHLSSHHQPPAAGGDDEKSPGRPAACGIFKC